MANIDLISGGYTIPGLSTQQFTFWWPRAHGNEFFDVSISPKESTPSMSPLIEVKRERAFVRDAGEIHHTLFLTLQNDNDFPVEFSANHVRVY